MPKVSVIMPVYNGAAHIREAIESVLAQTFTDWDFWVINEFGSNDGTVEIVNGYARNDARFHLIQNESRQGLAESINIGFRAARGEYLARLDADDLAYPERFAKQVALMDENPQVGICGTYQHHFGAGNDWVHCPPCSAEDCRARLVFNCDLCHSTLMLRRETVLKYGLFYDPDFAAEDYELWGRASLVCDIVNIPEVLGEYRHDGSNITEKKLERLDIESGQIVGINLARALDMRLSEEDCRLFQSWRNPFDYFPGDIKEQKLQRLEEILREIYKKNLKKKVFNNDSLLSTLACKWRWAKYYAPWNARYTVAELDEIFDENYRPSFRVRYRSFCEQNKTFGAKVKRLAAILLRPIARPFRRRMEGMLQKVETNVCNYIEDKTWDRYLRLEESNKRLTARLQEEKEQLDRLIETANRSLAAIAGNIVQATEDRVLKVEYDIIRALDDQSIETREKVQRAIEEQIGRSEDSVLRRIDERAEKSEDKILRTVDGRVWKAEENILQTIDGRIWKAEGNILQTIDGRVWKAEDNILRTVDGRTWKAEEHILKTLDKKSDSAFWNMLYEIKPEKMMRSIGNSQIYDSAFYWENRYESVLSAQKILSKVFNWLPHTSVVDFGCGTGTWLWIAMSLGTKDILGIDGDYVPRGMLMIPEGNFYAANLEDAVVLDRRFDLAMSMEVGEHLHPGAAETFVTSICAASDMVLFSAAHPGQGGDGHINEQPNSYWDGIFARKGYMAIDIKDHFSGDQRIAQWYRDNISLYVKDEVYDRVLIQII